MFLFLFIFNTYDTTDPENVKVNPPNNTSNVTPDKQLQSPKKSPQPKPRTKKEWSASKCNKSYELMKYILVAVGSKQLCKASEMFSATC